MRSRMSHSKFKNTGILFELLTRQITAEALSEQEQSPALGIIREYFKPKCELGRELQLYRILLETTRVSEPKAIKLLDIVLEQRRKLNMKHLNEQKYALINKISKQYPLKEFLASPIPQYRVYASIYKTFMSEVAPDKIDVSQIREVAESRFTIIEHLAAKNVVEHSEDPKLIESYKRQDEDLRLYAYKILVDRFNEKYKVLDTNQRTLLRQFINNISNTNSLREYMNTEVPRIKNELGKRMFLIDDRVTLIKLEEVLRQLDTIKKGNTVKDAQVTALLIAYEIVKEIDDVRGS